jgi:hypothetical protein
MPAKSATAAGTASQLIPPVRQTWRSERRANTTGQSCGRTTAWRAVGQAGDGISSRIVIARPLMFVFWSLILWGTLYLVVLVHGAATQGFGETWHQALSGRDRLGGVVNVALAGIAVLVWAVVGVGAGSLPAGGREGGASLLPAVPHFGQNGDASRGSSRSPVG